MDQARTAILDAIEASDLPRPAKYLARVLLETEMEWLAEDWVLREVGCCSKRLREYRGRLNSTGLLRVRRHGPFLGIMISPDAREKCHALTTLAEAERAKSATLSLFDLPADDDAREKCHAERAKSATRSTSDSGDAREKCHACTSEIPVFSPENPVSREKCHAERAKSATLPPHSPLRQTDRLVKLINNSVCLSVSEGGVGETNEPDARENCHAAPALEAAPKLQNPDYARNRALLADSEVDVWGRFDDDEFLAREYEFDVLLRQVFQSRRDVAAKANTDDPVQKPNAYLVGRLRGYLAGKDKRRFQPARKLTLDEQDSGLYRRHAVLVTAASDVEPEAGDQVADVETERVAAPAECGLWDRVRSQLRRQVAADAWVRWLRDSHAVLADGVMTVAVPNDAGRELLDRRLRGVIERMMAGDADAPAELVFVVGGKNEH